MTKHEARLRAKAALASLDAAAREESSLRIAETLCGLPAWKSAGAVLVYLSLPAEVDTAPIIEAARRDGKTVAAPRISGQDLVFHLMEPGREAERRGALGLREPGESWPLFRWREAAGKGGAILAVVPGLAFDRFMNRLGRGKGFYDRFLRNMRGAGAGRTSAVAVCFSRQLMEEVPHGPEDERVDGIVTERGFLESGSPA